MGTATTALYGESETRRFRRMTVIWGITVLLLLPVLALLGYFMRLFQSAAFPGVRPEWFYAVLTLHSLGMVGTWFVGSMAGVSYLLLKYTRPRYGMVFSLPLASDVARGLAALGHAGILRRLGHSGRLLDNLDSGHSALNR
jgi:heme/copper-type cytochrome/quinol oxidase subunit 1